MYYKMVFKMGRFLDFLKLEMSFLESWDGFNGFGDFLDYLEFNNFVFFLFKKIWSMVYVI